jgi:2-methylcitrate dehydratase PrpD
MTVGAHPDLAEALSEHAVTFLSDHVDRATLDHLRANLLDVLAVTIGGVEEEGLAAVRTFLRTTSAGGPAVVIGTSESLALPAAAMANATAAHALEFDDAFDEGGGMHAGPPVHSAALAVADGRGDVSGREYLAAVAVGLDVAVRLALAPEIDVGWHRASVFAVFGATVAAGRLLRLNIEQMRNALGLALSQASGTRQPIFEASLATRLHTGFAARNAVTAALLAQAGITAAHSAFEGPNGFFPVFQQGRYDRDVVLEGLGDELWAARISTKPFPGGRVNHAFVEAALQLYEEKPAETVAAATLFVPPSLSGPTAQTWPEGRQATYSLPFGVALALATGRAPINAFVSPESAPPSVRAVFDRIAIVPDPTGSEHGVVEVTYPSGAKQTRAAERASGYPGRPLTADAQLAKVWACFDHAGEPLTRQAMQAVIDLTGSFEEIESTTALTALLGRTSTEQGAS